MIATDILHDAIVWPHSRGDCGLRGVHGYRLQQPRDDAIRAWLSMTNARWLQARPGGCWTAASVPERAPLLGGVLFASVAVQVLRILQAWLLGMSLGRQCRSPATSR